MSGLDGGLYASFFVQVGAMVLLARGLELLVCTPAARAWLWRIVHVKFVVLLAWPWPVVVSLPGALVQPAVSTAGVESGTSWMELLLLVHGVGAAWLLAALWRERRRVHGALAMAAPLPAGALRESLARVAARMERPVPRAALVSGGCGPAVVGLRDPVVLLPERLGDMPRDARDALIAHELAHLERRDLHWRLLFALVRTLFWTHPLLWYARRRAEEAEEAACDRRALAVSGITPGAFGRALVEFVASPRPAPVTTAAGGSDLAALRRRLRLLGQPRGGRGMAAVSLLVAAHGLVPLAPESALPLARPVFIHRAFADGSSIRVRAIPAGSAGLRFEVERPRSGRREVHQVASLTELGRRDALARRVLEESVIGRPRRAWLFGAEEVSP